MANTISKVMGGILSVIAAFVGAQVLDDFLGGVTFGTLDSAIVTGLATLAVLVIIFVGLGDAVDDVM